MRIKRPIALAAVTAALAGIGAVPLAAAATAGTAHEAAVAHVASKTVQVSGGEFFFKLSTKTLAKPGAVTFNFKNVGHVLHDFSIKGKKTSLIGPGKTAKLVVKFARKGKYPYLCTVPGHAAAGMRGVFTVK